MLLELLLVVRSIARLAWPDLMPDLAISPAVDVVLGAWGLGLLVGWCLILRNLTGRWWPALVPLWGDALLLRQLGYTKWWWLPCWLLAPACAVMRFVVPIALVSRYRRSTAMLVCVVLLPPVGLILLALTTRREPFAPQVRSRRVHHYHVG